LWRVPDHRYIEVPDLPGVLGVVAVPLISLKSKSAFAVAVMLGRLIVWTVLQFWRAGGGTV